MARTRIVNGVRYRWTRKGWEATGQQKKPVHWSDIHRPGIKSAADPKTPAEPQDSIEGQGDD